MNVRAIATIVQKDLKVVSRSKGVLVPLIIVPLVLTVALPGMLAALPTYMARSADIGMVSDMQDLLQRLPASLQQELAPYSPLQRTVLITVVYYLAPFFLILPLMVATVIAADSIAGEKERKTLEALLYTPTTDRELFLGKVLAALVPAVLVAWIGFILYTITVNVAAWPLMQRVFFPTTMWYVLVIWVSPAVAGLGLGATAIVSARVTTFQEAYQIGGIVVTPVVALVVAQAAGALYFSTAFAFLIGGVLWLVDAVLLWYGARAFHRQKLALRL